MKHKTSLILAPCLLTLMACSTHYRASSHHGHHHGSHVSVGVHGHSHSKAGTVLGALVIGGIIGHMIAESAAEDRREVSVPLQTDDVDQVVNGYSITTESQPSEAKRWYQRGKDGKCYLMEKQGTEDQVVSLVPDYACS